MKAISTKYFGPGNVRGSRVSATDNDGNRVFLHWDDSLDTDANHDRAAKTLCIKCGWTDAPLIRGSIANGGYVYVFANSSDPITFSDVEQATGKDNRRTDYRADSLTPRGTHVTPWHTFARQPTNTASTLTTGEAGNTKYQRTPGRR